MDTLKELGEFLQTYGGWGVAVLFGAWIYYKERIRQKERKEISEVFAKYQADIVKITAKYESAVKSFAAELRDLDQNNSNKKSISEYIPHQD